MRPSIPPEDTDAIFIDESNQTGPRYLVIGGVVFPERYAQHFEQYILDARGSELPSHHTKGKHAGELNEIGWNVFTPNSVAEFDAYVRVVNAFHRFPYDAMKGSSLDYMHFHCAIVDLHHPGRHYTGKHGEIGFNREIYFHCLRMGRHYIKKVFHVYPDSRNTKLSLMKLQIMLCGGLKEAMPLDGRFSPYRKIEWVKSEQSQAMQVSDIFIGAIGYRLNHYDRPKANSERKRLCDYILRKGNVTLCCLPGRPKEKDWGNFRIWVRQHRV